MSVTQSRFFHFAIALFLAASATSLRAQEQDYETLPAPIVSISDSGAYHAINQLPESIRSSAPFARDFYEFARHAGTSGVIDNDAYLSAFEEAQQDMLRASERAGKNSPQNVEGSWTNIGLTGADTIPSAGITTAIVFDPQHSNIMYAGGSGGGVWKSYDTGATWTELTDNILPNLSVSSIAVDPVNTNIVYVGTGYCYSSLPSYGGSGLYKSTDGGTTFAKLTVASNATQFIKVVVDPIHDSIVVAVCWDQSTVYRSTDFGATWKSVFASGTTWDAIVTPGPANTCAFYLIGGSGVNKSTNEGSTWTKVSTSNFPSSIGRSALASPTKAPNKVFALMTDPGGTTAYLYESTDTGKTWVAQDLSNESDLFIVTAQHSQGWYDLYLAVSPNSVTDDTIYMGGVVAFKKSGGTWLQYSDYNHASGGGGYAHVDHHSFAINPLNSNILYDGNDGGLWVNYAAGSNDASSGGGWQLHSLGMTTNRFYHLGLDRNILKTTWAGAQDQGLWKMVTEQPPAKYSPLGDAMAALVSSSNSSTIYAIGPEGQMEKATSANNWGPVADSTQGVTDAAAWDTPIKMAPIARGGTPLLPASSIIYVGRQHLWQTTDAGNTWKKCPPSYGLTGDQVSYISAIGLPNWSDSMIYVAGGGNILELSTDFGTTWHTRTFPASGGTVTALAATWHDTKFLVASLQGSSKKVMMSEDGGHTWADASGTGANIIPGAGTNTACNVMCVAIDSTNPTTTWYAGTDFGIYQTTDAGKNWFFMGPGLFPCRDVQLASNMTTLRVGTYGRGAWEVVLPIQFNGVESNSLTATKSATGTDLVWNVRSEPAGAMFYIERSVDGDAFARIGDVPGTSASSGTLNYSFSDNTTASGTYLYQIHEIDASGAEHFSNRVELHYGTNGLYLYQPYPNPLVMGGNSASGVTLNFELPARDNVQLRIYDIKGTLVRTLLNKPLDGGPQSAIWDARDDQGNLVQPGAYFYSVQSGNSGATSGKIVIVRE
jgi:photosystem II stability/assembly factor-like uncharacterized protein